MKHQKTSQSVSVGLKRVYEVASPNEKKVIAHPAEESSLPDAASSGAGGAEGLE